MGGNRLGGIVGLDGVEFPFAFGIVSLSQPIGKGSLSDVDFLPAAQTFHSGINLERRIFAS